MTTSIWLQNIGAFTIQLAFIIVVGAILSRVLHLRRPSVAIVYWRTLLLACLLLPLCQPWTATVPSAPLVLSVPPSGMEGSLVRHPSAATRPGAWPTTGIVLGCLGAGIVVRGLWLVIGAFSLQRLRRSASPIDPLPLPFREARARVDVQAIFAVSDRVTGPITFGLIEPIIVLPADVMRMDAYVQEAIAYHELLHVRRRDWIDEIFEEAVRTIFWFHPAVWWLVGRIQLCREQVVDQAAIQLTDSRERYLQALLTIALAGRRFALVPAPPFLRRRHLKKRLLEILQENTMTARRLFASLTVSAAALAFTGFVVVRTFPLHAAEQSRPSNGAPVQIMAGGDHLLHAELPEYPGRAIEQRVEGDVLLELAVDDRGEVADARVLSGPDELRKAALEAVLQWHYSPAALRSASTQVTICFRLPAPNAEFEGRTLAFARRSAAGLSEDQEKSEMSPAQRAERQMMEIELALADPAVTDAQKDELKAKYVEVQERLEKIGAKIGAGGNTEKTEGTGRLAQIRTERVPAELVQNLIARAGVRIGDPFTEQTARRIREAASSVDEHLRVNFKKSTDGIVVTLFFP